MEEIWHDFRVDRIHAIVRISESSALAGQTLAEAGLGTQYGARILGIGRRGSQREERTLLPPADFTLHAQDVLLLVVDPTALEQLCAEQGVEPSEHGVRDRQRLLWEMGAVTVLIHPDSQLIGKSLRDAEFRSRYGIDVIGLRRSNEAVRDFEDLKLQTSDSLLGIGTWPRIQQLKGRNHDFVVLETPSEAQDIVPAYRRMPRGGTPYSRHHDCTQCVRCRAARSCRADGGHCRGNYALSDGGGRIPRYPLEQPDTGRRYVAAGRCFRVDGRYRPHCRSTAHWHRRREPAGHVHRAFLPDGGAGFVSLQYRIGSTGRSHCHHGSSEPGRITVSVCHRRFDRGIGGVCDARVDASGHPGGRARPLPVHRLRQIRCAAIDADICNDTPACALRLSLVSEVTTT